MSKGIYLIESGHLIERDSEFLTFFIAITIPIARSVIVKSHGKPSFHEKLKRMLMLKRTT